MNKKNIMVMILAIVMLCFGSISVMAENNDMNIISISIVNQDPDPAIAGDILEVRIGVENTGGEPSNNLIVELDPEYPLELVPGEDSTQKVGTIKGFQDRENLQILKYRLSVNRDATAGEYELKVKYYEEGSKVSTTKSLSIEIESGESAEVIYIDKTTLVPGEESNLEFTINNVGNAPLRELSFKWQNPDKAILPVGSDNTKYIKYVDIGESKKLNYRVIADSNAEAGLYELNLNLEYEDPLTNELKIISTVAGIYVGGKTDFKTAFSESADGETSFSISNIGSNDASSISITIPKQEGIKIKGTNSVTVGSLSKGDYTIAAFKIIPDLAIEEIPMTIEVEYTDTSGKRHVVEKEILLDSTSVDTTGLIDSDNDSSKGTSKTTIILVVIMLAIGLYIGSKKLIKKKDKKN